MAWEWFLTAILIMVGLTLFGHFERHTAMWRRLLKWLIYMGVTALLFITVGKPWTLGWVVLLPLAGSIVHFWWCHQHGIHPLTAEPRDKYYALRGWHI